MEIIFNEEPDLNNYEKIDEKNIETLKQYRQLLTSNLIILVLEQIYLDHPELNSLEFYYDYTTHKPNVYPYFKDKQKHLFNDDLLKQHIYPLLKSYDEDALEISLLDYGLASIDKTIREERTNLYHSIIEETAKPPFTEILYNYLSHLDGSIKTKFHTFGESQFPEFCYNLQEIENAERDIGFLLTNVRDFNLKSEMVHCFNMFRKNNYYSLIFDIYSKESGPLYYTKNNIIYNLKTKERITKDEESYIQTTNYQYPSLDKRMEYSNLLNIEYFNKNGALSIENYKRFMDKLHYEAALEEKNILLKGIDNENNSYKINNLPKKRL